MKCFACELFNMVYKLDELQLLNGQDGVIVLQNIISHTRGLDIIRVGLPVKTFNAMRFSSSH